MTQARAFRFSRAWQRRVSGLLAAVLCLWLVSAATHFHTDDQERHQAHIAVHFCGFCGSISTGGAAATVVTFQAAISRDAVALVLSPTPPASVRLIVSHRSRAPPAA